ncbi:MAG: hypothetical protein ACE5JL_18185, partial [Dehalococcoidia bacterium]
WQALRKCLKIEANVVPPDPPDPKSPTTIRIVATNAAPERDDHPEIIFYDVELILGIEATQPGPGESDTHTITSQKVERQSPPEVEGWEPQVPKPNLEKSQRGFELVSGESVIWEVTCPFGELLDVQPHVNASVSKRRFFHVPQKVDLPLEHVQPKMLEYVRGCIDSDIDTSPTPRLHEIKLPTHASTISDIKSLREGIEQSVKNISETLAHLNKLLQLHPGPEAKAHAKAAGIYLVGERAAREELLKALDSTDLEQIDAAAKLPDDVKSRARFLEVVAQQILTRYHISGEVADEFLRCSRVTTG